jgi:hypothetical protein
MRRFSLVLFCLASCFVVASSAQPPVARATYVLVDARAISDDDLAKMFTALAQAYDRTDWVRFPIAQGASLADVLASQYNLKPTDATIYPKTYQAVWDFIRDVNQLDKDRLPPSIRLPPLPSIPNRTARPDLVQVQHRSTGYSVAPLRSLSSQNGEPPGSVATLSDASNFAFLDTAQFRNYLDKQGGSHFGKRLYRGLVGPEGDLSLSPLASAESCSSRSAVSKPIDISVSDSLKARIAQIPGDIAGDLYILDFDIDSSQCSHGRKVKEVATQLLTLYGAAHLVSHVKSIELNYYAHPDEVRRTLASILDSVVDHDLGCGYRKWFAESFDSHIDSCDKSLDTVSLPAQTDNTKPLTVPGYYLWLVFEYVVDSSSHASVVSSSFFTFTNGFEVASSARHGQWPALVAAVLNPDKFPPSHVDELTGEQPAKRFFEIRHDFGTFLVGGMLRDGSIFGMTSSTSNQEFSNAVTTFALAEGYGDVDLTSSCVKTCISPDDKGTSFATPAVSVELFLARALWRSELLQMQSPADLEGSEVRVLEAKRRLALSSKVMPELVGKAASAGVADVERLMAPANGNTDILIKTDGSVEKADVRAAFAVFDGAKRQYPLDFGGVQGKDGRLFVYDERRAAWREAEGDLYLEFQDGRVFNATSFLMAYQSLARYK